MPIACDPDSHVWIVLENDREKPNKSRPGFRCRYLTTAQTAKISEAINSAAEQNDVEANDTINAAICVGITNWRNMTNPDGEPIEFSQDALSQVLTVLEKFELCGLMVSETSLSEAEKKASGSPSRSSTGSSAEAAPPENAPKSQPS